MTQTAKLSISRSFSDYLEKADDEFADLKVDEPYCLALWLKKLDRVLSEWIKLYFLITGTYKSKTDCPVVRKSTFIKLITSQGGWHLRSQIEIFMIRVS